VFPAGLLRSFLVLACLLIPWHADMDGPLRAGAAGIPQPVASETTLGDDSTVPMAIASAANDSRTQPPRLFVRNLGQVDGKVKFHTQEHGRAVFFTPQGVHFALMGEPVSGSAGVPVEAGAVSFNPPKPTVCGLIPVGIRPEVELVGLGPQKGKVSFFRGSDPAKWQRGAPAYEALVYKEAYPGVDIKFYGNGPSLEYDLMVMPFADLNQIRFRVEGAEGLSIEGDGSLKVRLPGGGWLVQRKPTIYQQTATGQSILEGGFVLFEDSPNLFAFQVTGRDPGTPLVIDPTILYSTYLGGDWYDDGKAIAVDSGGFAYVTGYTQSLDFPVTDSAVLPVQMGSYDVFVTKMNTNGSGLVYSTFIGGSYWERANAIAVDRAGCAYLTGGTKSLDFPTTLNAFQRNMPDYTSDKMAAFVTKLSNDGSDLVYSTYLAGNGYVNEGLGIALDKANCAYISGQTNSTAFPLKNAIQMFFRGGYTDGFVTKLNKTGSALLYSTYLGGAGDDSANSVAVDKWNRACVVGETASLNFPVLYAMYPKLKGAKDAFAAKVHQTGARLIFSTYLGGSGEDRGAKVALDRAGSIYVMGETSSENFPVRGGFQRVLKGSGDVFVSKLHIPGSPLLYSTLLGGGDIYNSERALGIAVDPRGVATVMGWTCSQDFPLKNYYFDQVSLEGGPFLTRLSASGSSLVYSTFLGLGTGGSAMAMDASGSIYITGRDNYGIYTSPDAFQKVKKASFDAFVAKFGESSDQGKRAITARDP
jgi:hypothetical protein